MRLKHMGQLPSSEQRSRRCIPPSRAALPAAVLSPPSVFLNRLNPAFLSNVSGSRAAASWGLDYFVRSHGAGYPLRQKGSIDEHHARFCLNPSSTQVTDRVAARATSCSSDGLENDLPLNGSRHSANELPAPLPLCDHVWPRCSCLALQARFRRDHRKLISAWWRPRAKSADMFALASPPAFFRSAATQCYRRSQDLDVAAQSIDRIPTATTPCRGQMTPNIDPIATGTSSSHA